MSKSAPKGDAQASSRFNIKRFEVEQDRKSKGTKGGLQTNYQRAYDEMAVGRKTGHWSWYIFPQCDGLSSTDMGQKFAIKSRGEAEAYLSHPKLSMRLYQVVQKAMNSGKPIKKIFPAAHSIDAEKLRSCLTLFNLVEDGQGFFKNHRGFFGNALGHFNMEPDEETVAIFEAWPPVVAKASFGVPPGLPGKAQESSQKPPPSPETWAESAPASDNDDRDYTSDYSLGGGWIEAELEKVTESRVHKGVLEYKVLWKDGFVDDGWAPAGGLRQAPLKLDAFHQANPTADGPPMRIDIWRAAYFRGDGDVCRHADDDRAI